MAKVKCANCDKLYQIPDSTEQGTKFTCKACGSEFSYGIRIGGKSDGWTPEPASNLVPEQPQDRIALAMLASLEQDRKERQAILEWKDEQSRRLRRGYIISLVLIVLLTIAALWLGGNPSTTIGLNLLFALAVGQGIQIFRS